MSISDKAIQGRNGFLYLAGRDTNELLDYLQNEKNISLSALKVHNFNKKVTEALQVPFAGIIVPEAHCVYPENLPDGVKISENRPVRKVLKEIDSRYLYALDVLMRLKEGGTPAYTGRDSHWTYDAALASYLAIRGIVGKVNEFTSGYTAEDDVEVGDLQYRDVNQAIEAEKAARREKRKHFDLTFASQLLNHGNVITIYNAAGSGRCLAFGTSFSEKLIPAYASDFRELIFSYGTAIDPTLVALIEPDCVISEIPERFLHFPGLSVSGSSLLSLLIGMRSNLGKLSPSVSSSDSYPEDATVGARIFADAYAYIQDPSQSKFANRIDEVDNSVASKLVSICGMSNEIIGAPYMRLILSGQFATPDIIYSASELVDRRDLSLSFLSLLPESEAGLLTKIRILVRSGLTNRAKIELDTVVDLFGPSSYTSAYSHHLRGV